jgi:hypothetical protein
LLRREEINFLYLVNFLIKKKHLPKWRPTDCGQQYCWSGTPVPAQIQDGKSAGTAAIPCGRGIAQWKHIPEVTRAGGSGFAFTWEWIQSKPVQPSFHQL